MVKSARISSRHGAVAARGTTVTGKSVAARSSYIISDAEIDAALARGEELRKTEPRAQSVHFDRKNHFIVVMFTNGSGFIFPPELAEGLSGATDSQLAEVRVLGKGSGLHWESLNTDLSVPGLVDHVFGTRKHMARLAGQAKSAEKAAASRANGQKGGRPRKPAPVE